MEPVRTKTQISLQEKIAELERRIITLESQRTVTTTTSKITLRGGSERSAIVESDGHLEKMWEHFHAVFAELGKVFR